MKKNDKVIALVISVITVGLVAASFMNQDFFNWTFERHKNILSWAIQALLILPLCFFAYRKSFSGIASCIFLFVTSAFWFPAPATTDSFVLSLLYLKTEWIYGDWFVAKLVVTFVLIGIFTTLTLALWKGRLELGILTLFLICIEKLLWEFFFSEDCFSFSGIIFAVITSVIGLSYVFLASRKKEPQKIKGLKA